MFRFLRIRRNDGKDEYPASRLIDVRRGKASVEAARHLNLAAGDPVFVLRRVLEYSGQPVVLDEITLPAELFKGLTRARVDAYEGSMYSFFETQFGVRMLKAEEKLKAIAADAAAARILEVDLGQPLLAVDRVTLTFGDRPVEWRRGLCTTRRHHYLNKLG
jgi:GntR family transcriptional regulator